MGCLISTIVLAAIVAVVYYTWTNFGWAWMAPIIDEEYCHVNDNDWEDASGKSGDFSDSDKV